MGKILQIIFFLLLSGNAYLCFSRENIDAVKQYRLQFDNPASQKTTGEAESESGDAETEASAPCWDCYEKRTWTKALREELGKILPASFRTEDDETVKGKAVNCAGGGFQVVTDMASGAVIIVGSGVAYVIEPAVAGAAHMVDSSNKKVINLGKHRIDQAEYAFWYLMDGNLVKVGYEGIKGLVGHIAKAIKNKDTYAICESVGAIASTLLAPEMKLAHLKDKRMRIDANREQNAPLRAHLSEELKTLETKSLPDLGAKKQNLLKEQANLEQQLTASQAGLKTPNLSQGEKNLIKMEMKRIQTKIRQREEDIKSVQTDIDTAYARKAQIAKVLARSETLSQSAKKENCADRIMACLFLIFYHETVLSHLEDIKDIIPVNAKDIMVVPGQILKKAKKIVTSDEAFRGAVYLTGRNGS